MKYFETTTLKPSVHQLH